MAERTGSTENSLECLNQIRKNTALILSGGLTATSEALAEATAAAPAYAEGANAPLSQDLSGNLRTIGVLPTGASTSAKQDTQITAEQAILATAGATSGAAVITDANGTIQQYLRGLVALWLGGSKLKQLTGVPSNFAIATADGTVFTLAAGEIGFIQNLDAADALAVKKGASASTSSFSLILPCGSAADDGRGGSVTIDDWIGAVSVATMSGTGRYLAYKIAP